MFIDLINVCVYMHACMFVVLELYILISLDSKSAYNIYIWCKYPTG